MNLNDNNNNVTAVWSIEKIRHSDEIRGHRYEMKISVRPIIRSKLDNRRDTVNAPIKSRSFLIKDNDYPKYFIDGTPPPKDNNNNNLRMEKRMFSYFYDTTEIPFHLNYGRKYGFPPPQPGYYGHGANLNTGEYFMGTPIPSIPPFHMRHTRFNGLLPRYPPMPNNFNGNQLHKPFIQSPHTNNNNLHHHYYLNKDELPIFKTSVFEDSKVFQTPTQSSIPNFHNHLNNNQQDLPIFANQIPVQIEHQQRIPVRQIENQIQTNELLANYRPTQSIPLSFPTQTSGINFNKVSFGGIDQHKVLELNNNFGHGVKPISNNIPLPQTSPSPIGYQFDTSPTPSQISFFPQYSPQFIHSSQAPQQHLQQSQPQLPQLPQQIQHQSQQPHQQIQIQQIQQQQPQQQNQPQLPFRQQQSDPFHWYGSVNLQYPRNNINFQGSYPFQENTYSEVDPVFHGQSPNLLVSPISVIALDNTNSNDGIYPTVSQIAIQNPSSSYTPSTESHVQQIDPTFATPYNSVTTQQNEVPTKAASTKHRNNNKDHYPDSINAQLPPPDSGDDLTIPYVDATIHTEKPYDQVHLIERPSEQSTSTSNADYVTTSTKDIQTMDKMFDMQQRTPVNLRYKGKKNSEPTEKPSIKWIPKRTRQRKPLYSSSENPVRDNRRRRTTTAPTTVTETSVDMVDEHQKKIADIITEMSMIFHDEPHTTRSIKKSVSVRVGDEIITESPITTTLGTLNISNSKPKAILRSNANVTRMGAINRIEDSQREAKYY